MRDDAWSECGAGGVSALPCGVTAKSLHWVASLSWAATAPVQASSRRLSALKQAQAQRGMKPKLGIWGGGFGVSNGIFDGLFHFLGFVSIHLLSMSAIVSIFKHRRYVLITSSDVPLKTLPCGDSRYYYALLVRSHSNQQCSA